MNIASARPYVAAVFIQFPDGRVESTVIARGSREECEKAVKNHGEPRPPRNRQIARIWIEIYRVASAMGQE